MSFTSFIEQLQRHEGLRLKVYPDTEGVLTIGYGVNLEAGITEEEARYLLLNRVLRAAEDLGSQLPWTDDLDDARRHVLLNMCYNLGINRLLGFKNTLTAVKEGRYDDAAAGMLDSKWATQVGGRAVELAEQMRTGVEK